MAHILRPERGAAGAQAPDAPATPVGRGPTFVTALPPAWPAGGPLHGPRRGRLRSLAGPGRGLGASARGSAKAPRAEASAGERDARRTLSGWRIATSRRPQPALAAFFSVLAWLEIQSISASSTPEITKTRWMITIQRILSSL